MNHCKKQTKAKIVKFDITPKQSKILKELCKCFVVRGSSETCLTQEVICAIFCVSTYNKPTCGRGIATQEKNISEATVSAISSNICQKTLVSPRWKAQQCRTIKLAHWCLRPYNLFVHTYLPNLRFVNTFELILFPLYHLKTPKNVIPITLR